MRASKYNQRELEAGRLTPAHMRALGIRRKETLEAAVRRFQERRGLAVDGKAGPKTRAALESPVELPARCWPLLGYKGRVPFVTSRYGPRSGGFHKGADLYLPWEEDDADDEVYGYSFRRGRRKGQRWCWTPPECRVVVASAAGVVRLCGQRRNGYRYWVDHGDGHCTGYLHLDEATALVDQRAEVAMGQPLAAISPPIPGVLSDPHLHFEYLRSITPYRPQDPSPWLKGAVVLCQPAA